MPVELRPYQREAAQAAVSFVLAGEHPVISLPTGAGKSLVIARIVADLRGCGGPAQSRFIVVVPSRELAEQNERALRAYLPERDIGVMCASLGRHETDRLVTIGTPQSLKGAIAFDPACVLVDEAHGMPLHRGSWFARLFDGLPRGRATARIGLSATTFRAADGAIYGGPESWFSCQPYEISVQALVDQGFLAPVRYVAPGAVMSTRGVARTGGDFNQADLARANAGLIAEQVTIIGRALKGRRKCMIFSTTVEAATAYRDEIVRRGARCSLNVGSLSATERAAEVAAFKDGEARVAVTVSAALTGFDVPEIDVLACCRPTLSPTIHCQSIGRGLRPAPGKQNCDVLDFAGNVPMFGPVHAPHFDGSGQPLGGIAPWRACAGCGTYNNFETASCSHCGAALFVRRATTAHELEYNTISYSVEHRAMRRLVHQHDNRKLPVESLACHAYRKIGDPNSVSLMISIGLGGDAIVRQWFKRLGSRHFKEAWASLLGASPAPSTLVEAFARRHELIRPAAVDVEEAGSFWRASNPDYADDEATGSEHHERRLSA